MAAGSRYGLAAFRGLLPGLMMGIMVGVLTFLPACRQTPGERQDARQTEVAAAEWEWLQATKQRLDEQRARLARLAQTQAGARAGAPPPEELARLRQEVGDLAEELNRRLVEYINSNATGDETPGERQLAAIRMKSDEDILLAREYVEQAGDYRRAIEIYETALAADPDNPRLRAELETARARRYVTRERFALIKEGMTQEEVRRLLGPPNAQDVRGYPERGVTAWFYPKDASGAAAAVWFRKDGDSPAAYQIDFDALQPPAGGAPAAPPAVRQSN
ncbi:MAG TPA: tetratricopeptide repeat protein [Thermoanaerobaculia bacterium]|nr:tetratricopeptide repeat protein [Thermoanaerobaculia bacterium]